MITRDWAAGAACREVGLETFHPEGRGRDLVEAISAAKTVCASCPVRQTCLAEALRMEGTADRYSRDGIWGGLTGPERAALRTTA